MTDLIERTLHRLARRLEGRVSKPGDDRYDAATATWAKQAGRAPRAIAHCRTTDDVQFAVRAARDCDLPLSVRGGGHDWAGRALCDGLVIDLRGMNGISLDPCDRVARIAGGACVSEVLGAGDPFGLVAVGGSCGGVGMAGLTLGGGYGSLVGRFGLALDNLLAAEVVLADGSLVLARHDSEDDLFWALRGGGGNFGVVTAMRNRLHCLHAVRSGMIFFSFDEARSVLMGCLDIAAFAPDELTFQVGIVFGPDRTPVVMIVPTWSGVEEEGEMHIAPLLRLGTPLVSTVEMMTYRASVAQFDPHVVDGNRVCIETCWLPALDARSLDVFVEAIATSVSPGCCVVTHEFKGAAARVPTDATAFGLRREHVLVEILASWADRSDPLDEQRHRQWVHATRRAFEPLALPGGYPNMLPDGDMERAAHSYGGNLRRLANAKRHYDPDNVFRSAIPLPIDAA